MSLLIVLIMQVIYYEYMLHWLYSSAISSEYIIVSGYTSIQFSGFIASLCLLFYLKYTCIYGTFRLLANFDGVASISPPMPQCVAAMHLNSQLWRHFDSGIYNWLRRYIYNPISRTDIASRFLATIVCFGCIALWHLPLTAPLIMWLGLNSITAIFELWARVFARKEAWSRFRNSMSRTNYFRILALLGVPLFLIAVLSNLYFLSGNELIGEEFIKRILANSNYFTLYLLLALYFGANVSIDYNKIGVDLVPLHGLRNDKKDVKTAKKSKCGVM